MSVSITTLIEKYSMDGILLDEYNAFKRTIQTSNSENRFYVYFLTFPNGIPFYVGKGSGFRAWDHLAEFVSKNTTNKLKHDFIQHCLDETGDLPIIFLYEKGLTESDALTLEKQLIDEYGRIGIDSNGILTNRMPGGILENYSRELQSVAGSIGGNATKLNKSGIFSATYDRSSQTKKNWENCLYDHIDFTERGSKCGKNTRDLELGIFRKDLQHLRSDWAKLGAEALNASGNRSGCCSPDWLKIEGNRIKLSESMKKHREKFSLIAKKLGSLPWWTNGIVNKRSDACPGEDFYRGMTKKRKNSNK